MAWVLASLCGGALVFDKYVFRYRKGHPTVYLYWVRHHGELVELFSVDLNEVWQHGRRGDYDVLQYALHNFGNRYEGNPTVLVVGQAALSSDFGASKLARKKGVIIMDRFVRVGFAVRDGWCPSSNGALMCFLM